MRRRMLVWLVAVAVLVVVATAGAARDPRLEKLALRPADMRLAQQAAVQRSDLGVGWTRTHSPASEQRPLGCPGYRPDFSKFTISGQADSVFTSRGGAASVVSHVEVYATKADARGDFALSTQPPVARCLGVMLRQDAASDAGGFTFKLLSSRRVVAPRLGERAAAYRIVSELSKGGTSLRIYVDVVVVLRGRSIGGVFFTGALKPLAGQQNVAARMAARLR